MCKTNMAQNVKGEGQIDASFEQSHHQYDQFPCSTAQVQLCIT